MRCASASPRRDDPASLMHPHPAFRWEDRPAIRDLVRDIGFGAVFAATPDGPRVAHVPVVWIDDDMTDRQLAWAARRDAAGDPTLFFRPDPWSGFTKQQFKAVLDFVDRRKVGGTTPAENAALSAVE